MDDEAAGSLKKVADDLDDILGLLSATSDERAGAGVIPAVQPEVRVATTPVQEREFLEQDPQDGGDSASDSVALQIAGRDGAAGASGSGALQVPGLRRAPEEFGKDMYIASAQQIEQIVDLKVQKIQASLNALKRYTNELEDDLMKREDQLDELQGSLEQEQRLRLEAEAERDQLLQRRAALEAKLVDDSQAQQVAEEEVKDFDQQAEEVAERLARGEISEDEAMEIEEELIRAQARRLAAQEGTARDAQELQKVSVATEQARVAAERASLDEVRLSEQMQAMREEIERTKAERDAEAQKREEADTRFSQLVSRIQAKAGGGRAA